MKLTFLGTGTSFGVPQLGCGCAVCRSPDPRDRRTRVGAVVETDDGTRILIDTPPELRIQLIAAGISDVDAVLFTHDHADHTHGIDDLRGVSVLVINALFRTEHPSHLSIPEAVEMAKAVGAERTFLTHLTHRTLHADLEAELPRGIAPAFDGLTLRIG